MTLRPALDRLARGFRRMWLWSKAKAFGARAYRFDGERDTHVQLLRETEISLALMHSASDDPEHVRMASEIEHGAENRLTVLLGRARLTMEEKAERDAIQRALSARRQSFAPVAPRRFLPALPAVAGLALRPWMLWSAALAAVAMWGGYNDVRAGRAENQRDEAQRLAEANAEAAEGWREQANEYRLAVIDAAQVARLAADALERERATRARAAARERRRQSEIANVLANSPDAPDWSLRDNPESGPATD